MKKRRILISNMKIERLVVGPIETNCYLLHKEKHVLVIDPGEEAHKIIEHIGNDMVDGIVITHHHFDHVGALEELKEKYSVPVYDFYNLKEGIQTIGHFTFHVLYTPGHKEDLIVVGRDDATGNRPGPILCERWICTYGGFDILDVEMSGSRYGSAYVAKIAAEIKRRAPHYTNEDIAQLIFSTAEDLGNPGCDEVYGWGRLNPVAIWNELSNRGY